MKYIYDGIGKCNFCDNNFYDGHCEKCDNKICSECNEKWAIMIKINKCRKFIHNYDDCDPYNDIVICIRCEYHNEEMPIFNELDRIEYAKLTCLPGHTSQFDESFKQNNPMYDASSLSAIMPNPVKKEKILEKTLKELP